MTVRRFVAATARDCLKKVKEELGPEAVVVSNKPIEGGVEIMAMSPDSLDALSRGAGATSSQATAKPAATAPPAAAATPAESASEDDYRVTLSDARRQAAAQAAAGGAGAGAPLIRPWVPPGMTVPRTPPTSAASSAQSAQTPPSAQRTPPHAEKARLRPLPMRGVDDGIPDAAHVTASLRAAALDAESRLQADAFAQSTPADPQVHVLMDEMRTIKALLERQLAGFAWGEMAKESPTKALLLSELLQVGFSGQLARRLIQDMPENMAQDDARKWLRAAINRRLRTLPAESDFIDRGGVYALVGPTGVGKTTTTAKLAARCVVRYGADRLALLTTDSYRIGAHEQLRIYGRILGVPVYTVRDGEDLRRTLADLRDKHMVLIDTVGMSQRDRMVAEQAALLARSGQVNRLLLLNSGARGDTLDDVIRAYSGEDLAGCILTKVDEAPSLAPAIDCIVRNGLTLAYVANGQRVPEDLHLPNRTYLLHRALKVDAGETAHTLKRDEVGLMLPADAVRAGTMSPIQGQSIA